MGYKMKLFSCLFVASNAVPTVIWHGMGDYGNSSGMNRMKNLVLDNTENDYVLSLVIGDTDEEDRSNGFWMPVFDQLAHACDIIKNDPNLQDGYHGLGFSQGSQFLRGIAQTCPEPPMINLVSIDGQHQGVFGFPGCPVESFDFCEVLRDLLDIAYVESVQSTLVQAQYWHDPFQKDLHRRSSQYIGPINNEVREGTPHVEEYKTNLAKLENLVLCIGDRDITVIPRESGQFGFYADDSDEIILKMEETELYMNNQLPLKEMSEAGKIHYCSHPGFHMNFKDDWFIETVIPFLQ